jgi:DNA-binding transcriptional regulator YhcF (GntR family)
MITAQIDADSPVPPFEQLRSQIDAAIRRGLLAPGARLPTVRQLAGDLGLAPNTVARAYRALEEAGLVEARGRGGTTVRETAPMPASERRQMLVEAAARYLEEASRAGFEPGQAISVVETLAAAEEPAIRDVDPAALAAESLPIVLPGPTAWERSGFLGAV